METLTPAGDTGNTPAISHLEELLTKKNKIKCCHYLLKLYLHVVPNPYAVLCVCVCASERTKAMQKSQFHIFLEWNLCCQWARTLIEISSNLIKTAEHRFGTTWGWWGYDDMRVNDDSFHFELLLEWTISLSHYTMAILINRPLVVLYEMETFLSLWFFKFLKYSGAKIFSVD